MGDPGSLRVWGHPPPPSGLPVWATVHFTLLFSLGLGFLSLRLKGSHEVCEHTGACVCGGACVRVCRQRTHGLIRGEERDARRQPLRKA